MYQSIASLNAERQKMSLMPSSTTTPYVCRQEWPSCICGNSAAALTKVDGQRAPRRCSGRRRASDHPRPTLHAGPPAASTRAATEVSRYPLGARDSSNTSEGPRFLKVRNALGKFITSTTRGSPSINGYQRGRKELLEGRWAAGDGWGWPVGPLGMAGGHRAVGDHGGHGDEGDLGSN